MFHHRKSDGHINDNRKIQADDSIIPSDTAQAGSDKLSADDMQIDGNALSSDSGNASDTADAAISISNTDNAPDADHPYNDTGSVKTDGKKNHKTKKQKKQKNKKRSKAAYKANIIISVILMVVAVVLMSWPWVMQQITASGMLNEVSVSESTTSALSDEVKQEYITQAHAYNAQLARDAGIDMEGPAVDSLWRYEQQLVYQHDPMMSWVNIPSINVSLPIYHGTTEDTLMNGVGHLQGTSLPVGGVNTHCVLTAHSGMAGATMFDDIRLLKTGDLVLLHTMNDTLAYKVVSSEVIWPDEMDSLKIQEGQDMLTLVTCTPYGVNDHRLLVHCVRTDYTEEEEKAANSITNRHFGMRDIAFFIAAGVVVLFILIAIIHVIHKHAKKRKQLKAQAAEQQEKQHVLSKQQAMPQDELSGSQADNQQAQQQAQQAAEPLDELSAEQSEGQSAMQSEEQAVIQPDEHIEHREQSDEQADSQRAEHEPSAGCSQHAEHDAGLRDDANGDGVLSASGKHNDISKRHQAFQHEHAHWHDAG